MMMLQNFTPEARSRQSGQGDKKTEIDATQG